MDIKGIGNSGYDYIKSEPIKTENTQVADQGQPLEIKEIPSEKSLEMFARMLEIEGLLVDEKR